ncbi:antibiotic biosynthesis monooxygenase family protein [Amycolatopsis thailandensis]
MTVAAGDTAEFEREWNLVAAWVREQPGCLRQTLCRDESGYVLTSDWESEDAFSAFERSNAQHSITEPLRRLRRSARMRTLKVIAHWE